MKKLFRNTGLVRWNTIEKDTIDEIIFKTAKTRNRLMLELMARSCMRVGEVLKLKAKDIEDRKATIRSPKSGKEAEVVGIVRRSRKGVTVAGIREKTGFDDREIRNFIYKAKRQGKIKNLERGVYTSS